MEQILSKSSLFKRKIKVLVVDDSAFMRKAIRQILESDPLIEVVGIARDGQDALEKVEELNPDVVTLDINMPRMDGLTCLRHIMTAHPLPVVMISSLTQKGAQETFRALELGAVDFIPKLSGTISLDIGKQKNEIIAKVKAAARVRVEKKKSLSTLKVVKPEISARGPEKRRVISQKVVVIGVSTGGPQTLMRIIPYLPGDLPAALLIVQHMPPNFTRAFAERLNSASALEIKEAEAGDFIEEGKGYLAPGDYHMTVAKRALGKGAIIRLSKEPSNTLHRPSVDVTMFSVAELYGENTVGVILTGMGSDGAEAMKEVKRRGGKTIAQDEESSIIFGMPKAAIEGGCVDKVVGVSKMAQAIVEAIES
ncbi:chemotaxis response regulator protein-glutamate methylesterase [Candidatus Aerophobetes bacterium]|nr:chemotaxis response regulator protein-glutamate methylesterase [Candidatus Aerophobetes bacterium]